MTITERAKFAILASVLLNAAAVITFLVLNVLVTICRKIDVVTGTENISAFMMSTVMVAVVMLVGGIFCDTTRTLLPEKVTGEKDAESI